MGRFGQILYISPANHIVILRIGSTAGDVIDFPGVLADIVAHID